MKTRIPRAVGAGLAVLLLGTASNVAAHAQSTLGAFSEPPTAALARHLRTLGSNPRNLDALRGAGRGALDVGDLDAAVGFFARAEEVAPRDGRTKAGLGSAFTMLRQPSAALRYFQDAVSLGVPALEVARDRGLAYDLRGNTRMAQADYRLVLASRPDPEVTRRLALSQAIAGDGKAALATLDPQIRAKDPAAWRVRAFVLAIGGDATGATRAAQAVMSSAQASAFAPYFRRMASLKKGEKAAAAHFGSFPGDPGTIRLADLMSEGERAARVAIENAAREPDLNVGRPDTSQAALGRSEGQVPASTAGSRVSLSARPPAVVAPRNPPVASTTAATGARPGFSSDTIRIVGTRVDQPVPTAIAVAAQPIAPSTNIVPSPATAVPAPTPAPVPPPEPVPAPMESAPAQTVTSATVPVQGPPIPEDFQPGITTSAAASSPPPAAPPTEGSLPAVTSLTASAAGSRVAPPAPQPRVETASSLVASAPPPSQPKVERLALASPTPPPSRPKVERNAPLASINPATRVEKPPRGDVTAPARHYAQVGIGQDVKALAGDWKRLRTKAGPVLADQNAWTAKLNRTNRLLVGPFDSARDAQAFVNKLAAAKLDAFVFSSASGEEVAPIGR